MHTANQKYRLTAAKRDGVAARRHSVMNNVTEDYGRSFDATEFSENGQRRKLSRIRPLARAIILYGAAKAPLIDSAPS